MNVKSPEERRVKVWDKPRPFIVKLPEGGDRIDYFNSRADLERLRDLGYNYEPMRYSVEQVVSYVELGNGKGARNCEICEDMVSPPYGSIWRGSRLLSLKDGTKKIVCHFHNPIEKEVEVYGR